jgi:hypothetical protein
MLHPDPMAVPQGMAVHPALTQQHESDATWNVKAVRASDSTAIAATVHGIAPATTLNRFDQWRACLCNSMEEHPKASGQSEPY